MNVQDLEVRLATQPNYPLAFELAGVAEPGEAYDEMACKCGGLVEVEGNDVHHLDRSLDDDHEPAEPEYDGDDDQMPAGAVWLVAGDHPRDTPGTPRTPRTPPGMWPEATERTASPTPPRAGHPHPSEKGTLK